MSTAISHSIIDSMAQPGRRGSYRSLPAWVWWALGGITAFLWLRAQVKGWTDIEFFSACMSWCHAGQWEGIYDQSLNPLAAIDYPVSFFLLLYPMSFLGETLFRGLLCTGIVVSWWLTIRFMQAGVRDRRVGRIGGVPTPALGPVVGLILAQRFLTKDLNANQVNMICLAPALIALAWMLPAARSSRWASVRPWMGCALLAVVTGIKLFPLAFLAMLWIKRAWKLAALSTALVFAVLVVLPQVALGPETVERLQELKYSQKWGRGLWLMELDSTDLWSFANFLHFRFYVEPWFAGLVQTPPRAFQLLMVAVMLTVGLPALRVMLRRPWSQMTSLALWEEVSLVGICWALIDPIGRTTHFVSLAPALGLIAYRRLQDWSDRRQAPRAWECMAFAVIVFTNLLLLKVPAWGHHHWYMHTGLFSLGLFTLYGMTLFEIDRHSLDSRTQHATAPSPI